MIVLNSNLVGIDRGSVVLFSDFEHDGVMWTGDGPRMHRHKVAFTQAFDAVPMVHVSISMWDMDHKANQRADIMAESVTKEGFEIVFRTWGDSRVARIRADWFAIGAMPDDDRWEVD